jgi:hypothetical protein
MTVFGRLRIFLKLLALFGLIFLAAYVARVTIVPNAMPIADGEQPGWQVQVAFVVTSIQNIGLIGMALVMAVALSSQLKSLIARSR